MKEERRRRRIYFGSIDLLLVGSDRVSVGIDLGEFLMQPFGLLVTPMLITIETFPEFE